MPEPETDDEDREPADSDNLWDQLSRVSDDTLITLEVEFEDVEDEDGGDYESNPYGGR
jgi:hypothetical protein